MTGKDIHYMELEHLIKGVFDNIGITREMEILEGIVSRPAMVADMGFRIIAGSMDAIEKYCHDYQGVNLLDEPYIELIRSNYIFTCIRDRSFSSTVIQHAACGNMLVASIKISNADVLMLIILENGIPFQTDDFELVKKVCRILSVEFQKENSFNRNRMFMMEPLLASLLYGKEIDSISFFSKAPHIPWIRETPLYLMLIAGMGDLTLDFRVPSIMNALIMYVPLENCRIFCSNIIVFMTKDMLDFVYCKAKDGFLEFLLSNQLCASISPEIPDILQIDRHYKTTQRVLKTAEHYKLPLVFFPDAHSYILAELLEENYDLSQFICPSVVKLLHLDTENHTEFLNTLSVYIENKSSPDTAAEKLYIHRSTLFYRIRKIKEITGIDYDNIPEMASVYFSFKLLDIYGKQYFLPLLN